ncbi:MAG: hypothetical protein ACLRS8_17790 [Parabacteroides merdae]
MIDFMTRYFDTNWTNCPKPVRQMDLLGRTARGGDNLMVVYWLYNITGDKFLLDLGELIHKQTFNWTDIFLNQNHLRRQHSLHCVNLAQGFKEPIVYYQQGKDSKQNPSHPPSGQRHPSHHRIAYRPLGGDELLALRQTDDRLRALYRRRDDVSIWKRYWRSRGTHVRADYLERVAYNALPTK